MPLDVTAFADELFNTGGADTNGIAEGALDSAPVDFSPTLNSDFRDMGGLQIEADSAFFDALQRGTDNMQGSLYATANAIGSLTGFDSLAEFGEEGFRDQMREAAMNPAHVESFEDIDSLSTLGTYIAEAVGENVMNMGLMATGGGIGVKAAQAGIGKAAIQNMTKQAASKAIRKGAVKGAAVPSYGLGAGEVQGEFIENGVDAPGTALLAGIPIAGLDVFGLERILGVAFKGMPISSAKQLVSQAAKAFGVGAGAEMPTEAAQELIGMVAQASANPDFELFTEENAKRLAEAGIKGGLAGGVMGGAGSTAVGVAKGLGEKTEAARTELKARMAEGLDPEDQGPGPTAPEPSSTLQAGVDAVGRGGRKAAYSADPKGFDNVALPEGYVVVEAADGGAYAAPSQAASVVMEMDKAGKQAEILGYPSEKPTEGEVTVVQAKDAQGRTVQDVVTDEAGLDAAFDQGEQAAGPGGNIDVKTPGAALNEREDNFDDDAGTLAGEEESRDGTQLPDPDDLIGALTDEAMQQEAISITAKHNTTARLINKIYGSTSKTNTDGSREITVPSQDPKATQGDPNETHPLVIKAVAKMFDDGKTEERGRIQVHNPHSKGGTNTPVSMPAVIRLGRQLNMLNDTATDRKSNLLTGLGYQYEKGFIPQKVRVKQNGQFVDRPLNITNGKETRLGLPLNTVIDGREENGTAVTFGDVMGVNANKEQKKLQDQYDKKSQILKAMTTGTQYQKNRAAIKHKVNATMLGKEVAALKATLKEEYGVDFNDGQGDSREIEQAQEAKVVRGAKKVVGRKSGTNPGNVEEITAEHVEDTRGMETDEDQARASARDVLPKAKASVKFPVLRNNKVSQYSEKLNKKLVDMAGKTLKVLGIKTQVTLMDEAGAVHLIETMKAEIAENPEHREVLEGKIAALELLLTDSPAGRIIYNDHYELAEDRVPFIFVSQNNTKLTKQIRVLTHELGHLVQRAVFDQAPKDVQAAIVRSMAGLKASSSNTFPENFANLLWRYMMDLDANAEMQIKALGSKLEGTEREAQLKDLQVVSQFFKKLAAKLRKLWHTMRRDYKLDEEYKEFVDAMVGVRIQAEGKQPVTRLGKKYKAVIEEMTMGPFLPYRTDVGVRGDNYSLDDIKALADRAMQHRRAGNLIKAGKGIKMAWGLAQDKVLRSSDAFLRSLNSERMTKLADQFHHQPGTVKTGRTFFQEKRYEMGQRQGKLDSILLALPAKKAKGYWALPQVDNTSGEYVQLMEMLVAGVSRAEFQRIGGVVGETGVKVRDYFDEMIVWQEAQGMNVRKRKNYFPAIAEKAKWASAEGQAKVRAAFHAHGYPADYAQRVIDAVIKSDGYLADTLQNDDSLLGPGFNFMKKRKLSPEILAELYQEELMVNDLGGIMQAYTHASVERGVTQRRWGLSNAEKIRLQGEFKALGIADQHLNSPVARLHLELARAQRDQEITPEQFRVVKNKVLEAYFGRLGANIDPRWSKFQSIAIFYQNIRLLSMATLTALVDAGQIVWRSGDAKLAFKGLQTFMNKQSREELYEMAHLMGTISDQVTEHVLNDQTTTQFMSPKMKRWNENFFRMIGMAQWTSMTRVMSLSVGREFLVDNANKALAGDAKAIRNLEELGVTADQVHAWQADGHNINDGAHGDVVGALDTFIDEAIIRPDATVRPAWASDRHWQILFHLKSFMWGYQEVILRRVWNQAKNEPTKMKALQQGGLSAAVLVAATLPLAIAGYEIRRLLSWWGNPPAQAEKHGIDYLIEVAERAGYLGIFQFIADAEQASDFGRLSLLSAAGPSLGQLEEFLRDDYASIITRATPLMAQSGAARAIGRDILRGN